MADEHQINAIIATEILDSLKDHSSPSIGPEEAKIVAKPRGRMEGFIILDYAARFPEAIGALAGWLKEGKLKQKEDVAIGLENAPNTLARLFTGKNFGKQLLKIADPPLERVN